MTTQPREDPSPDEIRAACLEIESTWSAAERLRRLRVDLRPTYTRADGEREEIGADDYEAHHEQRDANVGDDGGGYRADGLSGPRNPSMFPAVKISPFPFQHRWFLPSKVEKK